MREVGRWKSIPFDITKVAHGDLDFAPVSPNRRRKKAIAGLHMAMQQGAKFTLAGAVQGKCKKKVCMPSDRTKHTASDIVKRLESDMLKRRMASDIDQRRMRAQPADGDLGSSSAEHVQYSMWQTRRNPNLPSDSGGLHCPVASACSTTAWTLPKHLLSFAAACQHFSSVSIAEPSQRILD